MDCSRQKSCNAAACGEMSAIIFGCNMHEIRSWYQPKAIHTHIECCPRTQHQQIHEHGSMYGQSAMRVLLPLGSRILNKTGCDAPVCLCHVPARRELADACIIFQPVRKILRRQLYRASRLQFSLQHVLTPQPVVDDEHGTSSVLYHALSYLPALQADPL
jgi:hypothetical protein